MDKINITNILFLDIETVPQAKHFKDLSPKMQELWLKKAKFIYNECNSSDDLYFKHAGIYAEFGKIICISLGYISKIENKKIFRIKSLSGDKEDEILKSFKLISEKFCLNKRGNLCAHNGKEFDFPFIIRRMLINGIELPPFLRMYGKKPWEIPFIDTMELWKFGDYKNYTSLDLLSAVFGLSSPKDDIDGSMIADIYWKEKDINRIMKYCEKDTLTVAKLLLKYFGEEMISDENVEYIE